MSSNLSRPAKAGSFRRSLSGGKMTMRYGIWAALILGSAWLLTNVYAEDTVKSGTPVGEYLPGPFQVLNVTGANKGKKFSLYCSNGSNPVAAIFAREASPAVAKLLKQLDDATVKNSGAKM